MKKFVLLLIFLLNCQLVFASPNSQILDKIEDSLYGYTYSNESDSSRLNRLEEKIYGKTSNGEIQTRIAKLKKDISADQIGKEIEPCEDTFAEPEDSWVFAKEPAEASKMDYPAVDELERAVFQKEFKDEKLPTRLSKLETKTFGKTFESDDLSTRVDRLKAEIKPKKFMDNKLAQQENAFYDGDVDRFDENYHLDSYGNDAFDYSSLNMNNGMSQSYSSSSSPFGGSYDDYEFDDYQSNNVFKPAKQLSISSIEKTLYKTKFENEPMSKRLSRVESSIFGTEFSQDSESERLMRISSAINAQKSARKYDRNKFGQNMATAFQIGTLILMVLACIL